jgi:hypothetical protein
MTGSAAITNANASSASVSGKGSSTPGGLSHFLGLKTAASQQLQTGAQGFGSSLRSILASAGIPEDKVVSTVQPEPASGGAEQTQGNDAAVAANGSSMRGARMLTAVEPRKALAQVPAPPATVPLKASTLESGKGTRIEHPRREDKREPHPAKPVQTKAVPPAPPMAVAVAMPTPQVRVPAQMRTPSSAGAEPAAGSPIDSLHPNPPIAASKAEAGAPVRAKITASPAPGGAPSQTKSAPVPAFDQAMDDASPAGPDAQASGTGTELTAVGDTQSRTMLGPEQAASLALNHGAIAVSSPAAHQEAGKLRAAGVSSSHPKNEAEAVAAPAVVDERLATGRKSAPGKMSDSRLPTDSLHAQAQPPHPAVTQTGSAVPMQAGAIVARDASAVNAASDVKGSGGVNGAAPSITAETSATRETFTVLDGAGPASATTWVHASAHHAEAGFQDPAIGWVGVRAQADANGVHAALVPGSSDAAQALGTHLAGLNAYLAEQHTQVATLTVAAHENHWAGQGMSQGAGQNAGQNPGQGGHSRQQPDVQGVASMHMSGGRSDVAATTGRSGAPSTERAPGGVYISVMA